MSNMPGKRRKYTYDKLIKQTREQDLSLCSDPDMDIESISDENELSQLEKHKVELLNKQWVKLFIDMGGGSTRANGEFDQKWRIQESIAEIMIKKYFNNKYTEFYSAFMPRSWELYPGKFACRNTKVAKDLLRQVEISKLQEDLTSQFIMENWQQNFSGKKLKI